MIVQEKSVYLQRKTRRTMTTTATIDNNNGKRPLVSFIVTYHNENTAMLMECIVSIINLSLSKAEREIVVIDDGSDACPMNELLDYGDEIIYVRKPNGGLASSRNLGIMIATGEYIQFVDADDHLMQKAYEQCLDVVRYKDPDMVMFKSTDKDADETYLEAKEVNAVSGAAFMRSNNLRGRAWGYIFKKDILHNLRFANDIVHEDEEFTPQLVLRCERLFSLNCNAYFCRRRSESKAVGKDNRWKLKRLDDTETVIMRLYRRLDTLPHEERQALQRRIAQLTMEYLRDIIVLTRSRHLLNERIETLEREGLFPLPEKAYTKKYLLFANMIKTSFGRNILLATLPFISRR